MIRACCFRFRLNRSEVDALNRSQIATGSQKHRDPRFPPFAFTEHGAIMAATVQLEGYDAAITAILSAIRELMNPPEAERRGIGFSAVVE
jgi:hypothetical protein